MSITNLHISDALIVTFLIVIWLWWIKISWNDPEMSAYKFPTVMKDNKYTCIHFACFCGFLLTTKTV